MVLQFIILQDVVDAIYQISAACDHRRFVSIVSATGSVSDVVIRDQYGSYKRMVINSSSKSH